MPTYGNQAHMHLVEKLNMHFRLLTLCVPAVIMLNSCDSNGTLAVDAHIDSIAVYKSKRRMEVYSHNKLLKTYKIALGRQPKGHKQYEGDMRTPEGLYRIYDRNPNSTCYKNLGISYPNEHDKAHAKELGKSPGGSIKIHGLPNGEGYWKKLHTFRDWTYGCIAVTNEEMDELFDKVIIGSPICIMP